MNLRHIHQLVCTCLKCRKMHDDFRYLKKNSFLSAQYVPPPSQIPKRNKKKTTTSSGKRSKKGNFLIERTSVGGKTTLEIYAIRSMKGRNL